MKSRIACLIVLVLITPSFIFGEELVDPLPVIGGDFLVLVDCSRSMTVVGEEKKWGTGSDPFQLRWDAVKLFVDLLGPEDRIMIRRFSDFIYPLPERTEEQYEERLTLLQEWLYKNRLALVHRSRPGGNVVAYDPKMEFSDDIQVLSPSNRRELYDKIEYFNFYDQLNELGLDGGGTRILASLSELGPRLANQGERPIHVILITDGSDDELKKLKPAERDDLYEQNLKTHLKAYLGIGAGESKIAIHTFGLGLQDNTSDHADARRLLRDLAFRTGGEYQLIDNSVDIIDAFRKLVQKLKGCYKREISPETLQVETMVVNGIIDLGVISYAETRSPSPKHSSRPFREQLRFQWKGLDENRFQKPADDQRRTEYGKTESQYRYDYFGPAFHAQNAIGVSPFAAFSKPVYLLIPFPRDEDPQKIHILKRTPDLFELVSPAPGSTFQRFKRLSVAVRMKKNAYFGPEKFLLQAGIRPSDRLNENSCEEMSIKFVQTLCEDSSGDTIFSGSIPLTQLASSDTQKNEYVVAVRIDGTETPQHALSGMSRDLPERTFSVDNRLSIRKLLPIQLTAENLERELSVEVDMDDDIPILLDFKFIPPMIGAKALSADVFTVTASRIDGITADLSKNVPLRMGKGKITIAMKDLSAIAYDMVYAPGSLTVSHGAGESASSVSTTVGLRLDRSELELSPKISTLKPDENTEWLVFSAKTHPQNAALNVSVESLQPHNQPFTAEELWLEIEQQPNDESNVRRQTLDVQLGKRFRLCFRPKETRDRSGKHHVTLMASSEWSDDSINSFFLDVKAPRIELSQPLTAYARPGETLKISVMAHLKDIIASVESKNVFVSNVLMNEVTFRRVGKPGSAVATARIPNENNPVKLNTIARQIDFEFELPKNIEYGTYETRLLLSGSDLIDQEVLITLVINDFLFSVGDTEMQWTGVSKHLQLVDYEGLREIWIGTGSGEAMLPTDIDLHFQPPFRDDALSLQPPLPIVESIEAVVGIPGGANSPGLHVKIRFPAVFNPNSGGHPYKVKLIAISATHHLNRSFDFEVQFLRKQEIIDFKAHQEITPSKKNQSEDNH